jgi:hypothetical protein
LPATNRDIDAATDLTLPAKAAENGNDGSPLTAAVAFTNGRRSPAPSRWRILAHFAVGLLVWGSVGYWGYASFSAQEIDVLLTVPADQDINLSGKVLAHGQPLRSGHIQLVVDNPAKSERRFSEQLTIYDTGEFWSKQLLPREELRITARFVGVDAAGQRIEGEAVEYANCISPIREETLWKAYVAFAFLALIMVILFTSDLTQETAKVLFGATYLVCFLSVTLPLAVLLGLSNNQYMIDIMRKSPVGLVRATGNGSAQPQWFLNVGGSVVDTTPQSTGASTAPASPDATANPAEPGTPATTPPKAPDAVGVGTVPKSTTVLAAVDVTPTYKIVGGLAIPFYVIMLAVFGAGISMMRAVPGIQRDHLDELRSTGINPIVAVVTMAMAPFLATSQLATPQQQAACQLRKQVIDQYMYLLSAPFLAIAVYYLLQIIANSVTEPVLVLMAFSAGLCSELIVGAIVSFAVRTLRGTDAKAAGEQANGPTVPPPPAAPEATTTPGSV